jgi:hypothetical protein
LFFIITILPFPAVAQSFNIAAYGGLMFNSKTSKPSTTEHTTSQPGAVAGLQISYTRERWEGGLDIGYRQYAVQQTGRFMCEDDFDPLTGYGKEYQLDFTEGFPAITICPFIRRHLGTGKVDCYAGISAGYAMLIAHNTLQHTRIDISHPNTSPSGFTAGLHGGCSYPVTKHLAVQATLSAENLWLKEFSMLSGVLTGGVCYRFGQ